MNYLFTCARCSEAIHVSVPIDLIVKNMTNRDIAEKLAEENDWYFDKSKPLCGTCYYERKV